MQATKAAIFGLMGLAALSAAVYAMGERPAQQREVKAPPASLQTSLTAPNVCPSSTNGVVLEFADEQTDATRAAIKAFDEATRDADLREPDAQRLIQFIDINNDGNMDFMSLYTGLNWCGSIGCEAEVFISDGKGGYNGGRAFYTSKGKAMMLEATMNGFRQAITPVQSEGLPSERYLWRWNGTEYVTDVRCLQHD